MPTRRIRRRLVVVRALSHQATHGFVWLGALRWRCALGRSGIRAIKREGDGATPLGRWPLRRAVYRSDHVQRPRTSLPLTPIRSTDGWCDAPGDNNYNRPVPFPYPASAEAMWRPDHLYDLVLILGHNDRPRVRGGGSAIFLHLARPGYRPTEGCIALSHRDARQLFARLNRRTMIQVL
jgi:L,D-peptidoglycan transpeptidase YkuD (ErfK/YbiS/YcfS/YnhG family)